MIVFFIERESIFPYKKPYTGNGIKNGQSCPNIEPSLKGIYKKKQSLPLLTSRNAFALERNSGY